MYNNADEKEFLEIKELLLNEESFNLYSQELFIKLGKVCKEYFYKTSIAKSGYFNDDHEAYRIRTKTTI